MRWAGLFAFCARSAIPITRMTAVTTTDTKIPTTTGTRLLSKPEVLDRVGVTYQTIWAWMRTGKFPRSRVIGGKICWLENEIEAWMKALPKSRLKGDAEAAGGAHG
jgi:predicted DNA-binding transcriptional regulator AlpA